MKLYPKMDNTIGEWMNKSVDKRNYVKIKINYKRIRVLQINQLNLILKFKLTKLSKIIKGENWIDEIVNWNKRRS